MGKAEKGHEFRRIFENGFAVMEDSIMFVTSKVDYSFEYFDSCKDFQTPDGGGRPPQTCQGSLFLRLFAFKSLQNVLVAAPTQGQKCRLIAAMFTSINLLNLFQGLTCKPDREPKLYYTDTSFDAIGRVSQFSLGGRGLTYFFLTYCLPFPILSNSLTTQI